MAAKRIPDFRRAAQQRASAAEQLLNSMDPEHSRDAMYLAGYVIECALKALILRWTPRGKQRKTFENISQGAKGHDFDRLGNILKNLGCPMPAPVAKELREASIWSPDWRYEVGAINRTDAEAFLASAKSVRDWVERSW